MTTTLRRAGAVVTTAVLGLAVLAVPVAPVGAATTTAPEDETTRVIATLATPTTGPAPAAIDDVRADVLDDLPDDSFGSVTDYERIPAVSLDVDPAGLADLRQDPRVLSVQPDRVSRLLDAQANALVGATALRRTNPAATGAGTTVAVIDTGVDQTADGVVHPGLADDLVGQHCFRAVARDCPGGVTRARDLNGHGTHVAGIVTGPDGVAPDAGVYALDVFGAGDQARDSDILDALDLVASLDSDRVASNDVALVNLSLGGARYPTRSTCTAANPSYRAAFATLNALGVTVFAATGNDGSTTGVSAPACVDGAVGVGSVDDAAYGTVTFGDRAAPTCREVSAPDRVTCFSNTTAVQGPDELVDLLAPGCSISSLGLGGATATTKCGTSMATPYAAGSAALVLQAAAAAGLARPTPGGLEDLLEASGAPVSDPRLDPTLRFPRVSPGSAVATLTTPLTTAIRVSSPAAGATYVRRTRVLADFACTDNHGGTGVVSCTGTRAAGTAIDTTALGAHAFTVTLVGRDGTTRRVTRTYTVVAARPRGHVRTAARTATARRPATYVVTLRNDGVAPDRVRLAGARDVRGFRIRYRTPTGRDITTAVAHGAFVTPTLVPGAAYGVRVVVTATPASRARSLTTRLVLRSATDAGAADTVRLLTRRR